MEPTAGAIAQETAVLEEPVTAAVNCRVPEGSRLAADGERVTVTGVWRVTVAAADLEGAAALVAVTVTVCEALTELGAV